LVQGAAADGKALVMTNHHGISDKGVAGDQVIFNRGGVDSRPWKAKVTRLVAASKELDYALIEVQLNRRWLKRIKPVALSGRSLGSGQSIYSTGFPDLQRLDKGTFATHLSLPSNKNWARFKAGVKKWGVKHWTKTIQWGHEALSGETLSGRSLSHHDSNLLNIPGMFGSSGSPVIDAGTHRAVALYWGSLGSVHPGQWSCLAIPMGAILEDLGVKRRGMTPGLKSKINRLIAEAHDFTPASVN
jgi:hypothetical protein